MLTDQGKDIRIINLPETDEIKSGYSVPVDDTVDGTKKFDLFKLTTAIEGKADASEIEDLQEEIASKASPEEIEALESKIEEKASQDDLVTLSGTVDRLVDDVSEAQEDIAALQTAVEDIPIIPDTSAASAGDFLSFDGTGLEWTELPDMKVQAGTDLKVEENVVSVNTNGIVANSADMSFVAGSGTYARGIGSVAFGINTSAIAYRGAFAEGEKTYAEYDCHAEGWGTSALDSNSHAEGQSTLASARCSHTEGYGTRALNTNSHAEGNTTTAAGYTSHAEGFGTSATGDFSHAEGQETIARGLCSHATGLGTEAVDYAFACGKYNVANQDDLFTVGNGSNASNKSTCFRVDTSGNVSFMYNGVLTDLATTVADKEDKVFVAEVNVTTYDDIDAAYKAGKTIICKYQPVPSGNPEQIYYLRSMQYIPYGSKTGGYMFGTCSGILGFVFIKCEKPNDISTWTVYHNNALGGTVNLQNNGQFLSNDGNNTTWVDSPVPSVDTATDVGKVLTVAASGNKSWGNAVGFVKNSGELTDAATITASNLNNGFATLFTSQSALTIVDVVGADEIVNFAIEITPSVNCTLTIKKKVGSNEAVTLKHSVAAGNTLEANKTYQVTAVGNCWTLAEFEA